MKLSEVKEYVISRSRWCTPNCVETTVTKDHEYIFVANHYLFYKDKDSMHDYVMLKIGTGENENKLKLIKTNLNEVTIEDFELFGNPKWYLDYDYYNNYLIEIDIEIDKREKKHGKEKCKIIKRK